MTDPEREHFVRQLRDLERSRGRWRLAALALAAVLALPVVLGGLLGVAFLPRLQGERALLEAERDRAVEAEMRARAAALEAARLKDQAEQARQEAAKARGTGRH
jgi:hypothetical protein